MEIFFKWFITRIRLAATRRVQIYHVASFVSTSVIIFESDWCWHRCPFFYFSILANTKHSTCRIALLQRAGCGKKGGKNSSFFWSSLRVYEYVHLGRHTNAIIIIAYTSLHRHFNPFTRIHAFDDKFFQLMYASARL